MSTEWTPLHEWIAQFLMAPGTFKLAPCEMAYRIVDEVRASGILTEGGDAKQAPGESLSSPVASASPTTDAHTAPDTSHKRMGE